MFGNEWYGVNPSRSEHMAAAAAASAAVTAFIRVFMSGVLCVNT